jgi:hypothetical protein
MVDPTKVDFNMLPKKFCDGALGNFSKGAIMFSMASGNNLDSYATTPQVAKSIAMFFTEQIAKYEKQFGEIDMSTPEITSPFNAADFKPGEEKK